MNQKHLNKNYNLNFDKIIGVDIAIEGLKIAKENFKYSKNLPLCLYRNVAMHQIGSACEFGNI